MNNTNFTEGLKKELEKSKDVKKLICRECGELVPEEEISIKGVCARCIGIKVINSRKKKRR